MQGFAEKGDVEGTLWVYTALSGIIMIELSTSAFGDIYKFIHLKVP